MAKRFQKVYIEITNVCNLQCTFCPEVDRDKRFMTRALFQTVTEAVAPLTEEICLHLMGEPLLHPEFDAFLEICQAQNLPVNLTTNGLLLTGERMQAILTPIIRQVNFSLQSFESNFPGKDNSAYLQTIFDFTERAGHERPDLFINYRLWNDGAAGAQESNARMLAKIKNGLGVDFVNDAQVNAKKKIPLKGRASLHFDSRFEWPHPSLPVRSTRGFCHGLSSHIGILADGTVVPCCLDKEGVLSLGNCGTQKIQDILNSSRALAIRDGFRRELLVEDLCQKCPFIARFDSKLKKVEKAVLA